MDRRWWSSGSKRDITPLRLAFVHSRVGAPLWVPVDGKDALSGHPLLVPVDSKDAVSGRLSWVPVDGKDAVSGRLSWCPRFANHMPCAATRFGVPSPWQQHRWNGSAANSGG